MRDSREKGAGMRNQDPSLQTLLISVTKAEALGNHFSNQKNLN